MPDNVRADEDDDTLLDTDGPYGRGGMGSPFEKFRQRESPFEKYRKKEQDLKDGTASQADIEEEKSSSSYDTDITIDSSEIDGLPHTNPTPPYDSQSRHGHGGRPSKAPKVYTPPDGPPPDGPPPDGPPPDGPPPDGPPADLPKIMTKAEENCYSERYDDLMDFTPTDHWLQHGKKQGRYYRCGPYVTWIMAGRYIDRYYWVGDEYGRTWKSMPIARDQWYTNGSLQTNPKLSIGLNYPEEEAYLAGYETEAISCEGRIHLGLRMRPDNGNEIEDFNGLLSFARMTKKSKLSDGETMCTESSMDTKHHTHNFKQFKYLPKQCWCEPLPKYEPYHCSADGGNCSCSGGSVIYGAKFKNETSTKMANFQDVMNQPATAVFANKTDYVACDPSAFEGVDPLPGVEKECYCDSRKNDTQKELYQSLIDYWRGIQEEKNMQELEAKADAEAEAAEAEEDAENERLKEELAKTKAAKKASEAALKAKNEAAKKAAAEKQKALKEQIEALKKAAIEDEKKDKEDEEAKNKEFEAALKAAAEKAKEMEQAKTAKLKRKLHEEAEKAKAAAIKAEVAAALAKQRKENNKRAAEAAQKAEEERMEREKAEAEAEAAEEEAREKADAEEEEKRKEEEAKLRASHKAELRKQKAEAKAALDKALAEALEKQQAAFEKLQAAQEAERKRKEKEKQEKEAHELAKKMAAEKAAEEAQKAKEEEEAKLQAEAEAAEQAKIAAEKAALEEKRRLEKAAHKKAMEELKIKDDLMRAQRLEALAKTEAEVQAAQEEAAKAQAALEEAEADRKKSLEEKLQIEEDIKKANAKADLAQEKAAQAAIEMEEQKKKAANWKRQAEAAKKKAAKDMADAEAATAKRLADLEEKRKEAAAKQAAALKKQAAAFKKAQEAAVKAQEKAEDERKAKEAQQIAAHKKAMADRRSKFEKKFRNVWATGPTGVSYMQMTIKDDPSDMISRLYKETMVADEWKVTQAAKRSFLKNGHMSYEDSRHHVTFITSDDRVAEAIELIVDYASEETKKDGIPFDLIVTPLATGSKDYIDWVKVQTLKKDDSTAFFNVAPMKAMKPITTTVADKKKAAEESTEGEAMGVQTKVEESEENKETKKSKSLWGTDPEEEEGTEDEEKEE